MVWSKQRKIFLVAVVVAVVIWLGVMFFRAAETDKSFISFIPSNNDVYLREARLIIDQINSVKTETGFYGDYQICAGGKCQIHTLPQEETGGDYNVSWRENLSVIWGRYQYYLATGDEAMLAAVENDIANLAVVGIEDEDNVGTVLQSSGYKCLFLEPIINEEKISPEKRELARKLCLDTFYEYAPGNTIAYDQHLHRKIQIASVDEAGNPILGVFYAVPQLKETKVYDKEEVVAQIINNLKRLAAGETPQTYSPYLVGEKPESLAMQRQFFVTEAMAMVDRIGAMRIAKRINDETVFEREELDYLLLLDELIGWRENLLDEMTADDFCIHNLGLAYFVENYLKDELSDEEADQVNMRYGFGQVNGFNCNAGVIMVYGREMVNRADLYDFVKSFGESSLGFGILEGDDFWTERNALYAGMLATITEGTENED